MTLAREQLEAAHSWEPDDQIPRLAMSMTIEELLDANALPARDDRGPSGPLPPAGLSKPPV